MSLSSLPNELLCTIAGALEQKRDINSLVRIIRRIYNPLNRYLYNQNIKDEDSSALLSAARCGYEKIVRTMVELNCDTNAKNHKDESALFLAAQSGHAGVVAILLERDGIDLHPQQGLYGTTPLLEAARNEHEIVVKLLIEADGIQVDHTAEAGQEEVIKLLLMTGKVDINSQDLLNWTPLRHAVYCGFLTIVSLLMGMDGVNLNEMDYDGRTLLMLLIVISGPEMVKLLISSDKIDINLADRNGLTPLANAAKLGNKEMVECLLDRGANPCLQDNEGRVPLPWAGDNEHSETVKLLLSSDKVNSDMGDKWGLTPLANAAVTERKEMVECLLDGGANPYWQNRHGRSLLQLAENLGYWEIVKLLKDHMASHPYVWISSTVTIIWKGMRL